MTKQEEASRGRAEVKVGRVRALEDELLAFEALSRLEVDLREVNDVVCELKIRVRGHEEVAKE